MRHALLALLVLLTLGLSACGGDDDSVREEVYTPLPVGDVSKAEYIASADAICAEASDRGDKEVAEFFKGTDPNVEPTPDEMRAVVDEVVVPITEDQLAELRALEAPEEDADQLAATYDAVEDATAVIQEDPMILLDETEDPFAEANQLAVDYGFRECGENE